MLFLRFVLLVVWSFPAHAAPWGLAGDIIIRFSGDELSVCLAENISDGIRVNDISVSENFIREGGREVVWRIELKQDGSPLLLGPGRCVNYGERINGYKSLVEAKPLKEGLAYYARVNAVVADLARNDTFFYDAVFCVGKRSGGGVDYFQYKYKRDGSVVKPRCAASASE
ncbi:hypothetical protein AB3464_27755 [Pseudomonas asplenii]|uniref:hypothetical protein n=1 Tax=Pseudomonas asplenii TaxID=53407 RepID=UPI0011DE3EB6|nr:hypothetical protein [Pseudomonas fuscovaginae]